MNENGLVIKGLDGLYTVITDSGEKIKCKPRGVLRHERKIVNVGDRVILRSDKDGTFIEDISERKNCLIRPPVANLDVIFTVVATQSPDPVLLTVDKLISIAEHNKIEPVIIISKTDLCKEKAEEIENIYKTSGFKIFSFGVGNDVSPLRSFVLENANGKISAFSGASGVGKSTLINSLFPSLGLETGSISRKTERGKHTTRHVELFSLETLTGDKDISGYIADTPGFSMLDFIKFDFFSKDDLVYTFREFEPYICKCKYTKCSHTKEEGCKIIEEVKKGIIPRSRHESYIELYNQLKDKHSWEK